MSREARHRLLVLFLNCRWQQWAGIPVCRHPCFFFFNCKEWQRAKISAHCCFLVFSSSAWQQGSQVIVSFCIFFFRCRRQRQTKSLVVISLFFFLKCKKWWWQAMILVHCCQLAQFWSWPIPQLCMLDSKLLQLEAKIQSTWTFERPLIFIFFLYFSLEKKLHSCPNFLCKFF
jgi:hypothetical protein